MRIKFHDYYVKPLIEYCSSVWGVCSKENQTKIIQIQKKAARIILETFPLTPSKQMFQELKWLHFEEIVHKAVMVMHPNLYRLCLLILKITQIIH